MKSSDKVSLRGIVSTGNATNRFPFIRSILSNVFTINGRFLSKSWCHNRSHFTLYNFLSTAIIMIQRLFAELIFDVNYCSLVIFLYPADLLENKSWLFRFSSASISRPNDRSSHRMRKLNRHNRTRADTIEMYNRTFKFQFKISYTHMNLKFDLNRVYTY